MDNSNQPNYADDVKGKRGLIRLIKAFGYSCAGLKAACSESAFRQVLLLNGFLLIMVFVFRFSVEIRMVLIMASFLSWIVELFNTAIEAAVDHTSLQKHPLAKRAKDTASAAQLVMIVLIILLWCMALWHAYLS